MTKLFTKKPLWAVVFAAAAIFAVTFIACDNGTTTEYVTVVKVKLAGVNPGYAVNLQKVGGGLAGTSTWLIADDDGFIDAPSAGYYTQGTIYTKAQLLACTADTITTTGLTTGNIYSVNVIHADGTAARRYFPAASATALTAKGVVATDKAVVTVLEYAASAVVTAVTPASITGAALTTDSIYEVEIIHADGKLDTLYFPAGSATSLTVASAAGLVATDKAIVGLALAASAAITAVTPTAITTSGATSGDIHEVDIVHADGTKDTLYFPAGSATSLTVASAAGLVATDKAIVNTSPVVATASLATCTTDSITTAGATSGSIYTVRILNADGTMVTRYFPAASATALTATGVTSSTKATITAASPIAGAIACTANTITTTGLTPDAFYSVDVYHVDGSVNTLYFKAASATVLTATGVLATDKAVINTTPVTTTSWLKF